MRGGPDAISFKEASKQASKQASASKQEQASKQASKPAQASKQASASKRKQASKPAQASQRKQASASKQASQQAQADQRKQASIHNQAPTSPPPDAHPPPPDCTTTVVLVVVLRLRLGGCREAMKFLFDCSCNATRSLTLCRSLSLSCCTRPTRKQATITHNCGIASGKKDMPEKPAGCSGLADGTRCARRSSRRRRKSRHAMKEHCNTRGPDAISFRENAQMC